MMSKFLDTFYGDLNKLKLDQFPCGTGDWRLEKDPGYLEIGEVNQETLFSLEELAKSDVFSVQCDWSKDIASLRHLAVQKPHLISEAFIFQHFTNLRLVDRNIDEVDKGLLKFTNLEELSLTGNYLTSVTGSHLPRSLRSLHLFANKLEDLEQLTLNPPPNLQHLGVGYNRLTDISAYISPYFWPNLLSLDLSSNMIGSLRPTLDCVSLLPALRNLSLMNNPLTLAPGYMGCTLDLMSYLQILDDVSISDDDRLHFSDISDTAVLWDQAIFCASFPVLENLRQPHSNEAVDEAACIFPVQKKYSYLIRFEFLSDTSAPALSATPNATSAATDTHDADEETERANTPISIEIENAFKEESECSERCSVYESEAIPWDANMNFSKTIVVRCSKLLELEGFLAQEIRFTVVEKVVDSFTTIAPTDVPISPSPSPSGKKKGKDDKKKKKDDGAAKPIKDKDGNLLKWTDGEPSFSEIANITADIKTLISSTEISGKKECTITEKVPVSTPLEDGRTSCASMKGKGGGKKVAAAVGKKKAVATPVPVTPPEPLRLEFKLERVSWRSVEECRNWNDHVNSAVIGV